MKVNDGVDGRVTAMTGGNEKGGKEEENKNVKQERKGVNRYRMRKKILTKRKREKEETYTECGTNYRCK